MVALPAIKAADVAVMNPRRETDSLFFMNVSLLN